MVLSATDPLGCELNTARLTTQHSRSIQQGIISSLYVDDRVTAHERYDYVFYKRFYYLSLPTILRSVDPKVRLWGLLVKYIIDL
jgi:hypothetical protein